MKEELQKQFDHLWRTFERVVNDFEDDHWIHTGFGMTTPARTAYHILQSTRYYIADDSSLDYAPDRYLQKKSCDLTEADMPPKMNLLHLIAPVSINTGKWVDAMDFDAENTDYPWTGETKLSVVLFLIRHSQYHLGEINALLNEQLKGKAADHFAQSL